MENESSVWIVIAIVLILFLASGIGFSYGGMMGAGNYGMMGSFSPWNFGFMNLFMGLFIVVIVLAIVWLVQQIQLNNKRRSR